MYFFAVLCILNFWLPIRFYSPLCFKPSQNHSRIPCIMQHKFSIPNALPTLTRIDNAKLLVFVNKVYKQGFVCLKSNECPFGIEPILRELEDEAHSMKVSRNLIHHKPFTCIGRHCIHVHDLSWGICDVSKFVQSDRIFLPLKGILKANHNGRVL